MLKGFYWIKDYYLMIITNERFVFLDFDLNEIKHKKFFIWDFLEEAYSLHLLKCSHIDECGFILSVGITVEPGRTQYKTDYLSPFVHSYGMGSWLMRAYLDKDGKLKQEDTAENSTLIWYEVPEAILEYHPGKIIVSMRPSTFLFLEDWVPIRHLQQ